MARENLKNFGFPRWGGYGQDRDTEAVRMCDYTGCDERGVHPAPKAPGSSERWYFCRPHAAEYNRNWDFFAGMKEEEAARRMAEEEGSDAFAASGAFESGPDVEWGGAVDAHGIPSSELSALDALDLDSYATADAIKRQHRKLAKQYHPDANPGDPDAAAAFMRIQAAYDLLKRSRGLS